MKHTLVLVLAVLTVGLSRGVTAAPADRVAWFYDVGYLVKDLHTQGWIESANGQELYYFQEVARDTHHVELYDSTRQIKMLLSSDTMYLKGPTETQWRSFKNGRWDYRRIWSTITPSGVLLHFQLIGAGMYRYFTRDGTGHETSTYLRETSRDSQFVRLLDPRSRKAYALSDSEMYVGLSGSGILYVEQRGSWK
jgi:hypothetical protein